MTTRNTTAIVANAKNKTAQKVEKVLREIEKIGKHGGKITIYSIAKITGVSRSFLYNNEILYDKINSYRTGDKRSDKTLQSIIASQNLKINNLKKEINELKKNENFKKKNQELLEENKNLKKQLEMSYAY